MRAGAPPRGTAPLRHATPAGVAEQVRAARSGGRAAPRWWLPRWLSGRGLRCGSRDALRSFSAPGASRARLRATRCVRRAAASAPRRRGAAWALTRAVPPAQEHAVHAAERAVLQDAAPPPARAQPPGAPHQAVRHPSRLLQSRITRRMSHKSAHRCRPLLTLLASPLRRRRAPSGGGRGGRLAGAAARCGKPARHNVPPRQRRAARKGRCGGTR